MLKASGDDHDVASCPLVRAQLRPDPSRPSRPPKFLKLSAVRAGCSGSSRRADGSGGSGDAQFFTLALVDAPQGVEQLPTTRA